MKVEFEVVRDIVAVPEQRISLNEINIVQIIDNSVLKFVKAYTEEVGILTLWEGDAYDTIGQWTDSDVVNRVNELYP